MLATYMRRMRNNNLEIRIVGSSCLLQVYFILRFAKFGRDTATVLEFNYCRSLNSPPPPRHPLHERFCTLYEKCVGSLASYNIYVC